MLPGNSPIGPHAEATPPTLPAAPPTRPRPLRAPRSSWPTTLGTVCIILGSLGAFWGLASALGGLITSSIKLNGTPIERMNQAMAPYQPWVLGAHLAAAAAAALLLAGGIALSMRRRWAVTALRWWAAVKLLVVPLVAAVTFYAQHAQQQAVLQDPRLTSQPGATVGIGVVTGMTLLFAILLGLWGWALPIFTLIWFARPKIRADVRAFR